jgi:hypothetical protein
MPGAACQATDAVHSQASAEEGRQDPYLAATIEQPHEAQVEDEVATKNGVVDIASIMGAPTVTVVRSTL